MLSTFPCELIETGPLPDDLLSAYSVAVKIAEVANALSRCAGVPKFSQWVLAQRLEDLQIPGDVFTLLTANAQELNSVRDRPASYWNIAYPNAHLVAYELWDRLLSMSWRLANSLGLECGLCCADRFDFAVFRLAVLKDHGREVRNWFSKIKLPTAESLLAELALEVSKAARQRNKLTGMKQHRGTTEVPPVCEAPLTVPPGDVAATPNPKHDQEATDESAFRRAKEFLDPAGYPKDYAELRRALDENAWIRRNRPVSERTGKPVSNRLRIHAGDWHEHLERRKQTSPDLLDMPAHIVDAMVQEVKDRKTQENRRRTAD